MPFAERPCGLAVVIRTTNCTGRRKQTSGSTQMMPMDNRPIIHSDAWLFKVVDQQSVPSQKWVVNFLFTMSVHRTSLLTGLCVCLCETKKKKKSFFCSQNYDVHFMEGSFNFVKFLTTAALNSRIHFLSIRCNGLDVNNAMIVEQIESCSVGRKQQTFKSLP